MKCSIIGCTITSDERMMGCWVCGKFGHTKCAGVSARAADALGQNNGIRWCCPRCRRIDIQFYKFFKNTLAEITNMGATLLEVQQKFSKFSELFVSYPELDKFVASPIKTPTPKRRKPSKKNSPKTMVMGSGIGNGKTLPVTPAVAADQVDVTPMDVGPFSSSGEQNNSGGIEIGVAGNFDAPGSPHVVGVGVDKPENPPNSISSLRVNLETPATSNMANVSQVFINVDNRERSFTQTIDLASSSRASGPRKLTVIPARKTVFVSRFAPDTTTDDIDFYIKSNLEGDHHNLNIYKFKSSSSNHLSSFRIIVSEDIFSKIVEPKFWPDRALVKEFIQRSRRRRPNLAKLPQKSETSSKN